MTRIDRFAVGVLVGAFLVAFAYLVLRLFGAV